MRDKKKSDKVFFDENENEGLSVTINTERLYLKSITENDCDDIFHNIHNNTNVMTYVGEGNLRKSEESHELTGSWVERWKQRDPFSTLVIRKKKNNSFVGQVLLNHGDNPGEADLAYSIAEKQWRKRYATEATTSIVEDYIPELVERKFKVNGKELQAVTATVHPDNIHSKTLLEETLGFKYEKIGERYKKPRIFYVKEAKNCGNNI